MRLIAAFLCATLFAVPALDAQTRKTTPKKSARKAPEVPITRIQAEWTCTSELGMGVTTGRRFCDVLTGNDPKEGVLVTIPAHRGPVTISFELHNRHTYSAELVKLKQAYRKYTATVGVLTMDNTLVDRAVVQSEFRTEKDLFDRIGGGAGPGGVKAVAPSGDELITMELPEDVAGQVSILGEKLSVMRPDGVDNFTSPGRPIASISNVMLEFRPGPPPKKAPAKKP
ncbi:MAG TPA: hypothetical protein VM096_13800 [Vicinamibacterales bacterium]|nr:hypothetical protein [Vicinamibacterales bacterium]